MTWSPEARGRGVATEAARACLDWVFRDFDLPYVTAMIAPDNAASIAVAERRQQLIATGRAAGTARWPARTPSSRC